MSTITTIVSILSYMVAVYYLLNLIISPNTRQKRSQNLIWHNFTLSHRYSAFAVFFALLSVTA